VILQVNPNRMELLKLRKRLVIARRGHKLLQDKLEEMMRRFLVLLKDIDSAKDDFQKRNNTMLGNLFYSRISASKSDFDESLSQIKPKIVIGVSTKRIMNINIPTFAIKEFDIDKGYDFLKTSAQLDVALSEAKDYVSSLLRLAELLKALDVLASEIERTRRRVNALEYMLIPAIEDTTRYITQKLNEFERGNLVRLMRVKEIVRSHY